MEIHYESSLLSYVGKTWTPHLKAPTEDIQDVAGGTARKRVVFNGVGIEGAATDDNSLLQGSAIYLASLSFLFVGSAAITTLPAPEPRSTKVPPSIARAPPARRRSSASTRS